MNNIDTMPRLFAVIGVNPAAESFDGLTRRSALQMVGSLESFQSGIVNKINYIVETSEDNSIILSRANKLLQSENMLVGEKVYSISDLNSLIKSIGSNIDALKNELLEITALNEQDVYTILDLKNKVKDQLNEMPDFRNEIPDNSGKSRKPTDDNKIFKSQEESSAQPQRPYRDRIAIEDPRAEAMHIETGV